MTERHTSLSRAGYLPLAPVVLELIPAVNGSMDELPLQAGPTCKDRQFVNTVTGGPRENPPRHGESMHRKTSTPGIEPGTFSSRFTASPTLDFS